MTLCRVKTNPGGKEADFWATTPSLMAWIGMIFAFLALTTSSWAVQLIRLPHKADGQIHRSLFWLTFNDGHSTIVSVRLSGVDPNHKSVDPFCGNNQEPSVFAEMFPVVYSQGEISQDIFGRPNSTFKSHRDDNTNHWCRTRRNTVGLQGVAAAIGALACLITFLRGTRTIARIMITLNVMSAIASFVATCVFGAWIKSENDSIKSRDYGQESQYAVGFSWIFGVCGWIFACISVFMEISVIRWRTRNALA